MFARFFSPIPSRHCRWGFTLVEVLLAIVIGSLVLVTAYTSFSFGLKTRDRLEKAAHEFQEKRDFFDQISQEIRSSVSFEWGSFAGDVQSVRFKGFLPRELTALAYGREHRRTFQDLNHLPPVVNIEYAIIKTGDKKTVVKRILDLMDQEIEKRTYDFGIGDFRFLYQKRDEGTFQWMEAWEEEDFPAAVKFEIKDQRPSGTPDAEPWQRTISLPAKTKIDDTESDTE